MNIEQLLGDAENGLSKKATVLLARLVNDTCERLPEDERSITKVSGDALIYNLFIDRRKYSWSYSEYREIFKAVSILKSK